MHNGQLAVGLLDLRLVCVLLHAKNLIVVLALALLEFQLGTADLLCDAGLLRVGLVDCLQFLDCSFPISGLSEGLRLCLSGFGVRGVELQCALTVGNGFGEFLELWNVSIATLKWWWERVSTYLGIAQGPVLEDL